MCPSEGVRSHLLSCNLKSGREDRFLSQSRKSAQGAAPTWSDRVGARIASEGKRFGPRTLPRLLICGLPLLPLGLPLLLLLLRLPEFCDFTLDIGAELRDLLLGRRVCPQLSYFVLQSAGHAALKRGDAVLEGGSERLSRRFLPRRLLRGELAKPLLQLLAAPQLKGLISNLSLIFQPKEQTL